MASEEQTPAGLDNSTPNVARVYDYLLGGKDNFEVDREVAERSLRLMPDSRIGPRNNRGFLKRAVLHMCEAGIDQFLDLGSGLPTQGNVHEIAHSADPSARVVYVDHDAVVHAHANALLSRGNTQVVTGDVRRPAQILDHPVVRDMIDFSRPVGLLMLAILHHVNDGEGPENIAATFRDAVPAGSYLALSHFCDPGEERPDDSRRAAEGQALFNKSFGTGRWRRREELAAYFGDWELLAPGLVPLKEWRPVPGDDVSPDLVRYLFMGGVARKP